jgi:hypothetical protein
MKIATTKGQLILRSMIEPMKDSVDEFNLAEIKEPRAQAMMRFLMHSMYCIGLPRCQAMRLSVENPYHLSNCYRLHDCLRYRLIS